MTDEEGFIVDLAFDGEECLRKTTKKNYDLYIFWYKCSKNKWFGVLKLLRKSQDYNSTIYLTSYKDKDTLQDAFLKGCDDYLKSQLIWWVTLRIKALLKRNKKHLILWNYQKKYILIHKIEEFMKMIGFESSIKVLNF